MARIPLPDGLHRIENLPRTRRSLTNCFNNLQGQIISRPGILQLNTTARSARGQFIWNGALYQVADQDLIKIINTQTGAFTTVGAIAGDEVVETDVGFNEAVILVKGGAIYSLGSSNISIAISSVSDASGTAQFNVPLINIANFPIIGTVVSIGNYAMNTGYNVQAVITSVKDITDSVTITNVNDSGGIAEFVHAGATPLVGEEVTISGYTTNTNYNTTAIVTASTATTFQISSVPFGSDESGGSFITSGWFQISSVTFGTNEAGGSYFPVLTLISGNPNFKPSVNLAFINGRFVYIPADGDPAFFSDVGDAGSVQALSFFDAEELPDKNNNVFNFKNTLYIMGTDSIELFRDVGATPNPFLRIQGARITNGFIGGLIEYNETFLFIGREKDQDFGIYAIGQGIAPKISNEAIDLILSTYTQGELAAALGARFKWRGYDIAVFTLERDSFGFFGGNWFLLETIRNDVSDTWGGGFITQFEGEYFTAFEARIGKLAKVNSDYGEPINRIIDTGFEDQNNERFSCQSISLGISQGFSDAVGTVALFMSRNNVEYGEPLFRDLGTLGEYTQHLEWNYPGGMGSYDGFMGIRIYTTQGVDFSSDHLIANFR